MQVNEILLPALTMVMAGLATVLIVFYWLHPEATMFMADMVVFKFLDFTANIFSFGLWPQIKEVACVSHLIDHGYNSKYCPDTSISDLLSLDCQEFSVEESLKKE